MNEKLKSTVVRFKDHVKRQKFAYGYAVIAALAVTNAVVTSKRCDETLAAHGINQLEDITL